MLGACAGGTPAADAPESTEESKSDSSDSKDESKSESEGEGDSAEASEEGSSDEGAAEETAPKTESVQRLLTEEGTSYVYEFTKSEAGEKAEERCEKSSGGDAAKKNGCMNKATKAVKPNGFKFERDKADPEAWWFVRFEIRGTKPVELNRVKAEFADDTGKKITIKTSGPDKAHGGAKGAVPASFEIELPDQYTFIIQEPGRGKSVYEPKLGLFDADPRTTGEQ